MFKQPNEVGYGLRKILINKSKNSFSLNLPKKVVMTYNLDDKTEYHVFFNKDTGIISYVPKNSMKK